jgi:valyl-tRNA synthetase
MPEAGDMEVIRQNLSHIRNLARAGSVEIDKAFPKPKGSATAVFAGNQVHVLLKGLIDFEEEKRRLAKEIKKLRKEMEAPGNKLSNKGFLEKAPQEIVEKVKEKHESMKTELEKLERNLKFFEAINE